MTLDPPFRRVLVANRGEIALRIVRACHELGSEAVAVYSDPDRTAPHVRAADAALRLGPSPPAESYLALERLIDAARSSGADALHPGYGFLSERAELADACSAASITFVGPSPRALAGLGDKLAARRAATEAGVPVVPGMLEAAPVGSPNAIDTVRGEADRIGWPVLVKAAGGGGGRGMREVEGPAELPLALEAAAREAQAAFGDASVYVERLIRGGRHIEVQLVGDSRGDLIALGERDCSIQRRHQKLVEEAPAPGLSAETRSELYARAIAVASAVGLTNAATAEFLLDSAGEFWFLEINARLQVEHGITELVTGVDIVHEQLRIAAGRPLSEALRAAAARVTDPDRHAIEVRLGAEDPAREFAPTTGRISVWREPSGPGIRIDSGVEQDMQVGTDYDPLLAKLMVVAEDRGAAVARLERALRELKIAGLQTTQAFHAWLATSADFWRGGVSTDFVERHWRPEPLRQALAGRASQIAAREHIQQLRATSPLLPTTSRGGTPSQVAASTGGWRTTARQEAVERWPERDGARP